MTFFIAFALGCFAVMLWNWYRTKDQLESLTQELKSEKQFISKVRFKRARSKALTSALFKVHEYPLALLNQDRQIALMNQSFSQMRAWSVEGPKVGDPVEYWLRDPRAMLSLSQSLVDGVGLTEIYLDGASYRMRSAPVQKEDVVTGFCLSLIPVGLEIGLEKKRVEMISQISHDIRTPLTIVKGYFEMLRENLSPSSFEDGKLSPEIFEKISRSLERIEALIRPDAGLNKGE